MNNSKQGVDIILQAMAQHGVSFNEVVQAIETVGIDKQFQKDLDKVYYTEVLDDWDNWQ
tara:strand:+ start:399 stop:575 length:177 start_codon:yes stop_codon:yes gene_type:complete